MMNWSPKSWQGLPIQQQPKYADSDRLAEVLGQITCLPPLVHPGEVDALRSKLAAAGRGEAFLLQGGDCAERFMDCAKTPIERKLKILLQMSLVLTWGARLPVVRVGRIAGQFAKPRSKAMEVVDGREVHSYRGDNINGHSVDKREPDPDRLLRAYHHSAATLNYLRALLDGGFADLQHPEHWDLSFVQQAQSRTAYEDMIGRIHDTLDFMRATGMGDADTWRRVELFTSHEGLLLAVEEAHTEEVAGRHYNLGAHMLWIGDRTRQLDGAHIEYFRGLENPVGLKVGPSMAPDELVEVIQRLNPGNELGRLTLITRFGADKVDAHLPALIAAVQKADCQVVWSCDPMHGNTTSTAAGIKTRDFGRIVAELEAVFAAHASAGSILGGVHFELTGEDVTECTGGAQGLSDEDLSRSYQTYCDPRLNYAQSLELAFLIAGRLRKAGKGD
jgi:3-deoxy-7-phosphoheptulonate synthase